MSSIKAFLSDFLSNSKISVLLSILTAIKYFILYDRKNGMIPHLSVSETKLVHREALLKAKMNHVFDKKLGKTNWSIESRDNVKWITVNFDRDLILISTENSSNHDKIVLKILSMLGT